MEDTLLKATHEGDLPIGDMIIHCAVLEDGTRVLTQADFLAAIGRVGRPKRVVSKLPPFLSADNLKPFINEDLERSSIPIVYKSIKGGGIRGYAHGYKAELLPKVCDVILQAREAGLLKSSQTHIALQCEILVRALAAVGIIALVDEATGYQYDRDRYDLERLLAKYLSEERLKWAKMFPDEFYKQIYRLKTWPYPGGGGGKTPYVGRLTNELVYEKLPPGVLEELRNRNPVNPLKKRRQWCHHQFLSADLGQPDLRDHLLQVIALLRASSNWGTFKRLFARAFPKRGDQLLLDLPHPDDIFE
jgi:hypothetical protein